MELLGPPDGHEEDKRDEQRHHDGGQHEHVRVVAASPGDPHVERQVGVRLVATIVLLVIAFGPRLLQFPNIALGVVIGHDVIDAIRKVKVHLQ